jgi:uncharacterized protein
MEAVRYLYLHGFASSPRSTKARFFFDRFRECGMPLEVLDLAEDGFERLTITAQLQFVERKAKQERVTLLGSSLGGYLSALYAARHPQVERLVLLAPAFHFPTQYPQRLGTDSIDQWRRTGRLAVYHYGDRRERDLGYEFYKDAIGYEAEPKFRQPALILHGTRDDVVPAAFSQWYAERHPNVSLELVDSGHELTDVLPVLWEKTRSFLSIGHSTQNSSGPPR